MKRHQRKIALFILLLLVLSCFIFLFIETAEARAGGGGGGGSSSGARAFRLDNWMLSFYGYVFTNYGPFCGFVSLLPILLIHITTVILILFRADDKGGCFGRIAEFLFFIYLGTFYTSCIATPFILVLEICYVSDSFKAFKRFGKFVSHNEEKILDFKDTYSKQENAILSELKSLDSDFELDVFKERIRKAFRIIQEDWSNQNLTRSEKFLADGTYEQFQIQINNMNRKKQVDLMKDLEILGIYAIKVEPSKDYDATYVAIQAKAINYLTDKENHYATYRGNKSYPEIFTEIWCFMRRKGAKSLNDKGLMEGYCPNCGAAIEASRITTCPSCNSLLRSGQHDWILTGIYQGHTWKDTHNKQIPGLDVLLKYDPSFNIQNIEDKLSIIFWRIIETSNRKDTVYIKKIASDSLSESASNLRKLCPDLKNYDGAGIDSIEIVGIAYKDNKFLLLAEIIWNGYPLNDYNNTKHSNTLFVLSRNIKATTDIKKCFCNTHCISCGAPETKIESNRCEYCDNIANNDSKDWILTDICDFNSPQAKSYKDMAEELYLKDIKNLDLSNLEKHKSPNEPSSSELKNDKKTIIPSKPISTNLDLKFVNKYSSQDILRITIAVMLADGIIDPREVEIIKDICNKRFIPESEYLKNLEELKKMSNPIQYVLDTTNVRLDLDLLVLLIEIASADGEIADSETKLLNSIGEKMGLTQRELMDLINNVYESRWKKGKKIFK